MKILAQSYMKTRQYIIQGTHCTGKTGKMAQKIPCQGKHMEFGSFTKTQGKHMEFCLLKLQVVNSLILKVKDIVIFAAKKSIFSQTLNKSAS